MRKQDFWLCQKKCADELRSNLEADLCLCFLYTISTMPLLSKSKFSSLWSCSALVGFVLDPVGNPEDRFSRVATHYIMLLCTFFNTKFLLRHPRLNNFVALCS